MNIISFLGSFFQIIMLFIMNVIYINNVYFMRKNITLLLLLSVISGITFVYLGMLSIFVPIIVLALYNYKNSRTVFLSILIPFISLITLIISDHLAFIIEVYVFRVSIDTITTTYFYFGIHLVVFTILAAGLSLLIRYTYLHMRHKFILLERYRVLIVILVLFTIIFIYMKFISTSKFGFTSEIIGLNSIIIFIYILFIIVVLGLLMSSVIMEMRAKNKQAELDQLREYSGSLEDMYAEIVKFRHDYINILSTLSEYIRKRDMDQLEAYFNDKIIPTGTEMKLNNFKLASLKNMHVKEVKGILFSKVIKSQEHGIDISIEITEPIEKIHFDSIILCRCLGIILDNAVEEAMQHQVGKIIVAFIKRESSLLIIIANTIRTEGPNLFQMFKKGYSTKGNGRGIGLNNLRELVATQEHVTLDTKIEKELFFQEIRISEM